MKTCVSLALLAACRFHFDELPLPDAPETVLAIHVIGHGAVVGPGGIACAGDCTYTRSGAVDVALQAEVAWELGSNDLSCGPSCTIPAEVTSFTATFVQAPISANRVFVTSTFVSTNAGVANFDAECMARSLNNIPGTFVAFVSTSTQDATARLAGSRGWVRLDGLPVVDQITELGTSASVRPILFNELQQPVVAGTLAMTGSDASGHAVAGETCSDWMATGGPGTLGTYPDLHGIELVSGVGAGCAFGRLLCFETGNNVATPLQPLPFPAGRYVFMSTTTVVPVPGGPEAFDAACQSDATANGLAGTYVALAAHAGQSIIDRIGPVDGVYRRPDGIVVSWDGFATTLSATLDLDAGGHPVPYDFVMFTAPSGLASMATASATCGDWTDPAGSVGAFDSEYSSPFDPGAFSVRGCDIAASAVCVQR